MSHESHTQYQPSLNDKWTLAKIHFITYTFVWCLGGSLVQCLALLPQDVSGCDPDVQHAGYLCHPPETDRHTVQGARWESAPATTRASNGFMKILLPFHKSQDFI